MPSWNNSNCNRVYETLLAGTFIAIVILSADVKCCAPPPRLSSPGYSDYGSNTYSNDEINQQKYLAETQQQQSRHEFMNGVANELGNEDQESSFIQDNTENEKFTTENTNSNNDQERLESIGDVQTQNVVVAQGVQNFPFPNGNENYNYPLMKSLKLNRILGASQSEYRPPSGEYETPLENQPPKLEYQPPPGAQYSPDEWSLDANQSPTEDLLSSNLVGKDNNLPQNQPGQLENWVEENSRPKVWKWNKNDMYGRMENEHDASAPPANNMNDQRRLSEAQPPQQMYTPSSDEAQLLTPANGNAYLLSAQSAASTSPIVDIINTFKPLALNMASNKAYHPQRLVNSAAANGNPSIGASLSEDDIRLFESLAHQNQEIENVNFDDTYPLKPECLNLASTTRLIQCIKFDDSSFQQLSPITRHLHPTTCTFDKNDDLQCSFYSVAKESLKFYRAKLNEAVDSDFDYHLRIREFAELTHRFPYTQMPAGDFLAVVFDDKIISNNFEATHLNSPQSAILRSDISSQDGDGLLTFDYWSTIENVSLKVCTRLPFERRCTSNIIYTPDSSHIEVQVVNPIPLNRAGRFALEIIVSPPITGMKTLETLAQPQIFIIDNIGYQATYFDSINESRPINSTKIRKFLGLAGKGQIKVIKNNEQQQKREMLLLQYKRARIRHSPRKSLTNKYNLENASSVPPHAFTTSIPAISIKRLEDGKRLKQEDLRQFEVEILPYLCKEKNNENNCLIVFAKKGGSKRQKFPMLHNPMEAKSKTETISVQNNVERPWSPLRYRPKEFQKIVHESSYDSEKMKNFKENITSFNKMRKINSKHVPASNDNFPAYSLKTFKQLNESALTALGIHPILESNNTEVQLTERKIPIVEDESMNEIETSMLHTKSPWSTLHRLSSTNIPVNEISDSNQFTFTTAEPIMGSTVEDITMRLAMFSTADLKGDEKQEFNKPAESMNIDLPTTSTQTWMLPDVVIGAEKNLAENQFEIQSDNGVNNWMDNDANKRTSINQNLREEPYQVSTTPMSQRTERARRLPIKQLSACELINCSFSSDICHYMQPGAASNEFRFIFIGFGYGQWKISTSVMDVGNLHTGIQRKSAYPMTGFDVESATKSSGSPSQVARGFAFVGVDELNLSSNARNPINMKSFYHLTKLRKKRKPTLPRGRILYVLESPTFYLKSEGEIHFDIYKRSNAILLQVCLDSIENCIYESPPLEHNLYWRPNERIILPQKTRKIYFVATQWQSLKWLAVSNIRLVRGAQCAEQK